MNRRILCILMAVAVLLTAAACGQSPESYFQPEAAGSATAETWGAETPEPETGPSMEQAEVTPAPSQEIAPEPAEAENMPEPVPEAPAEEPEAPDTAREIVDAMSLEEKVAQLFVVTPEALTDFSGTVTAAGDTTRQAYAQYPVGGIVYMGANLQSGDQTRQMLENMRQISLARTGLLPFLCVDEEGGTVARISGTGNFGIDAYPDMSDVGASGDTDWAYEIGREMGAYLSELGFNVDFAPVADVLTNSENTVVRYRSFGSDPELVSGMATAFADGLQSQGVMAVLKHFPGHGATAEDSHAGFACSYETEEELFAGSLAPFQAGIDRGISMIMAGHIAVPNVTGDDTPATLSSYLLTDILREKMGYDGIIVTDALNMGAITQQYSSGEAAVLAIQAGVDLLLMPANFRAAYDAVLDAAASGEISPERLDASVLRIVRAKLALQAE